MASLKYQVDLTDCDKEPIHEIGAVQTHGFFFAVLPGTFQICAVSENLAARLETTPEGLIGRDTATIIKGGNNFRPPRNGPVPGGLDSFQEIVGDSTRYWTHTYWTDGVLAVELEPAVDDATLTAAVLKASSILASLRLIDDAAELTQQIAVAVSELLGFDRTMVYQFDDEFNGHVVAEVTGRDLEQSYLGQMFPHSDIPAQARALFVRNRVRAIRSATFERAEILPGLNPLTGRPFDLSDSTIRVVSPIHIRYLRNMGVTGSLAISLLRKQELWGLISCHQQGSEMYVPPSIRRVCTVLCETFSQRLAEIEAENRSAVVTRKMREINRLFNNQKEADNQREPSGSSPMSFVIDAQTDILWILGADAARIQIGDARADLGELPSDERMSRLFAAAKTACSNADSNTLVTDNLANLGLKATVECAGILFFGLPLNEGFLLAIRREQPRAVTWAGDPDNKVQWDPETAELHPRASFEKYQELRRGRSAPWPPESSSLAPELALRVLETFSMLARLRELELANRIDELDEANRGLDAFAQTVSHDLRSPQRAISGFSRLLIENYGDNLDETARDYLDRVGNAAERMGAMIDDLLMMSRNAGGELEPMALDLSAMVDSVLEAKAHEGPARIRLEIQPGVVGYGDQRMMRIALENLMGNALRFSSREAEPAIGFGARYKDGVLTYFIADNGVGFAMEKAQSLFEPFKRLHADEDFPGNGIGLATVKRIIVRHGGRIWAEAEPGKGATFYFTLGARAST